MALYLIFVYLLIQMFSWQIQMIAVKITPSLYKRRKIAQFQFRYLNYFTPFPSGRIKKNCTV